MRHCPRLAAALLSVFGADVANALPASTSSFTLGNGLVVVVIEDHRAPVVNQSVWYRVGSADDPAGHSGLAHFLEHLMFKATDDLPEGAFSRIVAENGGSDNAFTTFDHTAYYQRIAADRLDLVMGMEADRMVDLAPGKAGVLSERDVVIEERREAVDSNPMGAFAEKLAEELYPGHPYGRPVIGWEHEIAGLTQATAMDFYRAHYAPNNAVLIVAGDVDGDAVRRLAEKHFGGIPASDALALRDIPEEPPQGAGRRVDMRDPRVSEAVLSRIYLAPPRRSGDQRQAAALVVLAEVLGGSPVTSIMARDLIFGDQLAIEVGASYGDTGFGAQRFDLHVVPRPEVTLTEAETALDALLARFSETGPEPEQVERIKRQIYASEIFFLDDLMTRVSRVGTALASGLTLDDVAEWPALLQAVTPEEVQAAAKSLLREENSVTGWLAPADASEEAVK